MVNQGFPKNHRLLTSHDYKAVFEHASLKTHTQAFLILGKPNTLTYPRVGCVVAKKNIKTAVQRNRIKRIIRESFRQCCAELSEIDWVVMAKPGIAKQDNHTLRKALDEVFKKDCANRLTMHHGKL